MSEWRVVVEKLDRRDPVVKLRLRYMYDGPNLDCNGCRKIGNSLRRNRTAKTLKLTGCKISAQGGRHFFEALRDNETLETLNLSANYIDSSVANVIRDVFAHHNKTLRYLDLASNNIGVQGALAFANVLKHNRTLVSLNLTSNNIGMEGVIAIAESLEHNETLQILVFDWNNAGVVGATAIAHCLEQNRTLLELGLYSALIEDEGGMLIAEALRRNQSLQKLGLGGMNGLESGCAVAIGEALKQNRSMQELSLGYNSIGDSVANAIASGLRINQSLTKVDLQSNGIGSQGMKALGESLLLNKTLKELDLMKNEIDDEGMNFIAQAICDPGCTLSKLFLSKQVAAGATSMAFATDLANVLKKNTSLCVLELENMDQEMTDDGQRLILGALRHNTTLQEFRVTDSDEIKRIMQRNHLIAEKQPFLMQQENFALGLWPLIVAKWPANVVFGIFREKPDPLLSAHHG